MSEQLPLRPLDAVAQQWRGLAERRRAHLVALFESGRWKRYYSELQILQHLRDAILISERWAEIAPTAEEIAAIEQSEAGTDHTPAAAEKTGTPGDQAAEAIEWSVPDIARRSAA